MEIRASGSTASRRAPADYFSGTVWQDPVIDTPSPGNVRATLVHFEPGARTAWHTHPAGQTLYILSGVGRVQSLGGPVREVPRRRRDLVLARREALARRRPNDHHVAYGDHRGERRQICHVDGKSSIKQRQVEPANASSNSHSGNGILEICDNGHAAAGHKSIVSLLLGMRFTD
jgi:hypothetical protein